MANQWRLTKGRQKTNWTGRVFVYYGAYHKKDDRYRDITVIIRKTRDGMWLATKSEARMLAQRAVEERGDREGSIVIDAEDEVF